MTAHRALAAVTLMAAVFLPVGDSSWAQEQEQQPEIEESTPSTEDGTREPEPTPETAEETDPTDPIEPAEPPVAVE